MEVIATWIAPLLAVIAFGWSTRQFSLVEWVDGRMKRHFRRPATKGAGKLAWYALPISTLVLIGYLVRAVVWAQAHWVLIVFVIVVGALIVTTWRWRSRIIEAVSQAMVIHGDDFEQTCEGWRDNQALPDQMNNG